MTATQDKVLGQGMPIFAQIFQLPSISKGENMLTSEIFLIKTNTIHGGNHDGVGTVSHNRPLFPPANLSESFVPEPFMH